MTTATAYLYPWDVLGDPDAAPRIAGLGVDRVALAAAHHAVRAATPRHAARRVVDARHAALYVPVRPGITNPNGAGLELWNCNGGTNQQWTPGTGVRLP